MRTPAIALYRKYGFTEAGLLRDWRRLGAVFLDAALMEKFLRWASRADASLLGRIRNEPTL
jgi:ribosomal protein S18 acetylase RimI-like enzyme